MTPRSTAELPGLAVLLAYYAPPAAGIAAQRMAGIIRHLPAGGWEPVVVAPRRAHYHLDPASEEALEGVRVIRTPNPEPSRWLRRVVGGDGAAGGGPEQGVRELRPVAAPGWRGMARRLVRSFLYVPDAQALWIPWAARAAAEVATQARGRRRVVLFSSSVPFSAHFAARAAARRAGVPWVAEYRDPWSVAPPQFGAVPPLRALLDRRLDHDIVSEASALVMTSDGTAERYRAAFAAAERKGVHVVRNGFDPAPDRAPPGPDELFRLTYVGTLLHPDYAASLLGALRTLHQESGGGVRMDVYGPAEPWREAGGGNEGFLTLHGLIPAREIPARLAASSALVLLQPEPAHAQYIAGKLYEYLGSRRPVLAALPRGCEAERLIVEHGALWRPERLDEASLLGVLRRMRGAHLSGSLQREAASPGQVEPLTRRAQVLRLAAVLDAVGGA